MRRFCLLILCMWKAVSGIQAQEQKFPFEAFSLPEVFQKAKKEKKLVFMDCYTQWCDRCKLMEKTVFPREEVVRFFKSNFVCVQVNMGEGEGEKLAKKYGIQSFPALLFLDRKGNIQHMAIGFRSEEQFIEEGKRAMDSRLCLKGMDKRFKKGDREVSFLGDYVRVLRGANRSDWKSVASLYIEATGLKQRFEAGERGDDFMEEYANVLEVARSDADFVKFVPEYLVLLPVERMLSKRNWEWLRYYASNRWTKSIRKVADNLEQCRQIAESARMVNYVVDQALRQEMFYYLRALNNSQFEWNEEEFNSYSRYLRELCLPSAPECLVQLNTLQCARQGDYSGMFDCMEKVLKYNMFVNGSEDSYFLNFLAILKKCQDLKWVNKGVLMIDRCLNKGMSEYRMEEWTRLKEHLLQHAAVLSKKED